MSGNREQGSNWIRPAKRRRIYARDGWRCVWCCVDVYSGARGAKPELARADAMATLDHFLPRSLGGSNEACNLVTACFACNHARDKRTALEWAAELGDEWQALERALAALDLPLPSPAEAAASADAPLQRYGATPSVMSCAHSVL
jgi:hypothetical protein